MFNYVNFSVILHVPKYTWIIHQFISIKPLINNIQFHLQIFHMMLILLPLGILVIRHLVVIILQILNDMHNHILQIKTQKKTIKKTKTKNSKPDHNNHNTNIDWHNFNYKQIKLLISYECRISTKWHHYLFFNYSCCKFIVVTPIIEYLIDWN